MDVFGRGVVVTGGSQGLGRALALELALRGARVAVVARNDGPLAEVVAQIRDAGGVAHAIVGDVSRKDDVYGIAGAVGALVGEVDVLIHNASTLGPTPLRGLQDTACEDLAAVLETNVVGPFRLGKALIGPMLLRKRGLVVQISSDAATSPYPTWGAYGASKAAFDHLSRIWAAELEGTGVRMFGVDPGEMDTAMHAAALPEADRASLARPADVARIIAEMIASDDVPTGARLEASGWRAS